VGQLTEREEAAAGYYDEVISDYEQARLSHYSPVERAITARYLRRYIDRGAVVADVEVGAGYYAELLAREGYSLYLVDVSQRLLDATVARLRHAGLASQILDVDRASATQLNSVA
jgi:ubiquinone/menaquinone biosynthesis C-methylase UbiE